MTTTNSLHRVSGRFALVKNLFEYDNPEQGEPARKVGILTPKDWAANNEPFLAFQKDIVDKSVAKFGDRAISKKADGSLKFNFQLYCMYDGDESDKPWMHGHWLIMAKNPYRDNPPAVYDLEGNLVESDPQRQIIAPGLNATLFCTVYAFDRAGNKGVNARFVGVKLQPGGRRVEGAGPSSDEQIKALGDTTDALPPAPEPEGGNALTDESEQAV